MKLAIDFGTTNTVLYQWEKDNAHALQLPELSVAAAAGQPAVVPSLVYVQDGQAPRVCIGQAVRAQGLDEQADHRLFRNFKRALLAEKPPEPRLIDGVPWGERDAGRVFVQGILQAIPKAQAIEQLVLTAPVAALDSYLIWLQAAVKEFGLDQHITIVDESTAAALGYAVTEPGALVLVFDFGGGTLDLSLAQLPQSRAHMGRALKQMADTTRSTSAKVLAKAGQTLGGSDIDHWLVEYALAQCDLTAADLGLHYAQLLTACERAKIALSSAVETTLTFPANTQTHTLALTRTALENLLEKQGFYNNLRRALDKLMRMAHRNGVFKEDVQHVLLVGGTSLMPSVQAALQRYFGQAQVRVEKPFTAVAEGALQVAAGYGVQDRLPSAYGLRYYDAAAGQCRYEEFLPVGSAYPTEKPLEILLQAAAPAQREIELAFGEIDPSAVASLAVQYENGQTVFVAQAQSAPNTVAPLHDADHPPLRLTLHPPGEMGRDRVRLTLTVDAQRQLHVTAVDVQTRQPLVQDVVGAHLRPTKSHGNLITQPIPLVDDPPPAPPVPNPNVFAVIIRYFWQLLRAGTLTKPTRAGVNLAQAPAPTPKNDPTRTGREPTLGRATTGQRRFSFNQLANAFLSLPPDQVSPEAARAALNSPDYYVRFTAAETLARRGDRESRLILQDVLQHADARLRAAAARHLHRLSWYNAEPLIRQALHDADARVRENALYALCNLRELDSYQLLAEALAQEGDDARMAVAWGLGHTQDAAAVPALALAAQAEDPEVRVKAYESLGATGAPSALPVLRAALFDADPDAQYSAMLSFLEVGQVAVLPEVAAAIEKTSGAARYPLVRGFFHACNYLGLPLRDHAGFPALLAALAVALQDPSPAVRYQAAFPLAWFHHARTDALLLTAFANEPDANVQAQLVRLAADLLSPVAPAIREQALRSERPAVRAAAEKLGN